MPKTANIGTRLLGDLALFGITVAMARWRGWAASDLLWGLWASSLFLGYALLLTTLVVRPGVDRARGTEGVSVGKSVPLVFISIHFIAFHFGHSVFLDGFYPLLGPESDSGKLGSFAALVREALSRYWPFVLVSAAAMGPQFRNAFAHPAGKAAFMPYRNVVRMHVMIFIIGGLDAAGAANLVQYAALALYFFPFLAVRDAWKRLAGRRPS